jgi:hypothetical protein
VGPLYWGYLLLCLGPLYLFGPVVYVLFGCCMHIPFVHHRNIVAFQVFSQQLFDAFCLPTWWSSIPSSTRSTDSLTFGSGDFADFDFEREFTQPVSTRSLGLVRKNSLGHLHESQGYDDMLEPTGHYDSGLRSSGGALSVEGSGLAMSCGALSDRYIEENPLDIGSDMDISHFLQLSPGFKKEPNAG